MVEVTHKVTRSLHLSRGVRWALIAACGCILAWGLYRQIRPQPYQLQSSDFLTYYNAALAVRHGANPFIPVVNWMRSYTPGSVLVPSYYVYTPFFAAILVPFTALPLRLALTLWGICNLLFLVGAVYAIVRSAGLRPSLLTTLLLATAASALNLVRLEYYWGQADLFVLFFLSMALWARQARNYTAAGVLLGVVCVTKPPLLILVVFFLWKREFRVVLTTALSFALALLLPFLVLGTQAWRDQLAIWRFWSSQYLPFIDNNSPKGLLARLFTVNYYASPIVVAPTAVTVLWLMVCAGVTILLLAMIAPAPLRGDTRSLMEVGAIIAGMLLISPLTENIYLTLLIIPILSLGVLLREQSWEARRWRATAIGLCIGCLVLCLPLEHVEALFWRTMTQQSVVGVVSILLGAVYLYVSIAFFVLQLHALSVIAGRSVRESVRALIIQAVPHGKQWVADLGAALRSTTTHKAKQDA